MWLYLLVALVGALVGAAAAKAAPKRRPTPVEALKNGLLAFALATLMPDKIEKGPIMVSGTRDSLLLPPFSGSSETNAMMSYIRDPAEFRSDPMYSAYMARKYAAVDAFLRREFDTEERAVDFLTAFTRRSREPR